MISRHYLNLYNILDVHLYMLVLAFACGSAPLYVSYRGILLFIVGVE